MRNTFQPDATTSLWANGEVRPEDAGLPAEERRTVGMCYAWMSDGLHGVVGDRMVIEAGCRKRGDLSVVKEKTGRSQNPRSSNEDPVMGSE